MIKTQVELNNLRTNSKRKTKNTTKSKIHQNQRADVFNVDELLVI